ncbi:MAG: glycosyltransferase [Bacteroidota bacterium]|nr:glycosyltransferase [Cytophagales bacterium]MCE2957941.1 glycosyltransferase [Flammeovirgaceae bacterium]MCZ8069928.1 glycosyltransferase [Cytophagales bacterium]
MKQTVLIVGKFYIEGFGLHIEQTLQDMGHQTLRFDPFPDVSLWPFRKASQVIFQVYQKSPAFAKWQMAQLQKIADDNAITLVIACHDFLTPAQIEFLKKKTRAKISLWFPDAVSNFGKAMFLVAGYDAIFLKDSLVATRLKQELGLPAYYLPECCNPKRHKPVDLTDDDVKRFGCEISTAGNMHAARMAVAQHLAEYDVKIWGHAPPFWSINERVNRMAQNYFVADDEKSKSFLASKIVLNSIHPTEFSGVNVRTFEIAAVGAFQLTTFRADMPLLFEPNKEIVLHHSLSELKDQIKFYLANPELRLQIATAARTRAVAEHTYEKRLDTIISCLLTIG